MNFRFFIFCYNTFIQNFSFQQAITHLCFTASVALITFFSLLSPVSAIDGHQPASLALGQNNGIVSTPQPIFTKGAVHNAPHKLGFNAPNIGIALDATDHRLFIADSGNNRVLVYGLDNSNLLIDRIPDNVLGQSFFWTNAPLATQAGMNAPYGLAYDDANNYLYVSHVNGNRVTVYDVSIIVDGANAINVLGQSTFTASAAATTQVGVNVPTALALDTVNNRLFVSQLSGNRVTVFDTTQLSDGEAAIAVLGQANYTATTAGITQATLNGPYDALFDSAHNRLFVADASNNRVVVYDTASISDGENAVSVLGQANFTTATAATTQAGMNVPRGLSYDDTDQILFVAQATANRVTTYDVASITNGESATKVLGQANFTTSTAAVTQAGLSGPSGALLDDTNNLLYVLQSGASRISIFDVATITDGESATDALGQFDDNLSSPSPVYTKSTANNGPHKLGLNAPNGLVLDSVNHRLFVADTTNNRVLVYNLSSQNVPIDVVPDNVLGQAVYYTNAVATTQAGMSAPTGLAFDATRNLLFVSDFTNNRILVFDTASITDGESAVNVLGQVVFTVATAGITQTGLSGPRQIAFDSVTNQLFVADTTNNRVVTYDLTVIHDGELATNVLGQDDGTVSSPQPIFTKGVANNGPHKLGLNAPVLGITMDKIDHRLFISDTSNNRVLVYNLDTNNALLDRTPDNVIGQLNFYTSTAGSTRGGLNVPNGLDYDPTGKRLFVAQSTGNRVSVFDVATIVDGEDAINVLGQTSFTVVTAATTQAGLNVPTGVVFDDTNDRLFVAQNTANRVSVFNLAVGSNDYINADNALGQNDGNLSTPSPIYTKSTAHNGPNKLGLSAPIIGIAIDTVDHRLFLSDTSNNRILVYNLDGSNQLLDRIPDNVLGQLNYYSNTAANSQTGLSAPNGLAYDSTNKRLFVAEATGNRVKMFDVTSIVDGENAINVLGQTTFALASAATTQAGMNVPTGVAYGGSGSRLYVAQNSANRVTVYDVATITDGENAIAVLGQANFTTSTAATTQAGMNVPYDVTLSGSLLTTLFVAQGSAHRVTAYDVTSVTNGESATKVLGQANFTTSTAATTQAGMNAPRGIAYNATTKALYVAQASANRVTVYDVASITDGENAVNVLGQANFTTSTAASTQAGLNAPTGVAVDTANALLYAPQSSAHRVSIFNISSITDGENAVDALGQYDSDLTTPGPIFTKSIAHNGPSKLGLSAGIIGLALDPTGHRLFVADTGNNRVLVYNLDSNDLLVDTIPDGVLGQADFHSNSAATTQAGMNVPNGIAFDDANDRLFVAQPSANRVTVYDVASITNGENAVNVLGQVNFTSSSAVTSQTGMNVPTGVSYDATGQRLFVAQNTANRVTVYDVSAITDGENAINVLGQADFVTSTAAVTQAGMSQPFDVTLSGSTVTTLFVSQGTANRVTTYDVTAITNGESATKVLGQSTFTGTSAATTQAGMNAPRGISYDPTNKRLYVAQTTGARVTVYDVASISDGENAVNVIGQALFTTSTALVDQYGLSTPTGVLSDPAHNRLYVMDSTTNRVLSYTTNVGIGNGEPAVNVLGQANFTTSTAATTQAGMNVPFDLALSGTTLTTLFVSQGTANRVTAYDVTSITDGENAIKVLGQATFTTSTAATTQAGMNAPRGIAYNSATKSLYVSEITSNRVTKFDVAQITDGENAVSVLGQPNFITATAGVRQSGLSSPNGAYINTSDGKLYVPQSGAHRVSIFDTTTISDGENAVDVLGQSDDALNPPGAIYLKGTLNNASYKLGLSGPQGIAVDTVNDRLFVADSGNNRVLVYNMSSGHVPLDRIPDNVLGQPNYWLNTATTTQIGMSLPAGLTFDPTNNKLYVSDFTNNRVLVYDTSTIDNGEYAIAVLGQPSFLVATAGVTQLGLQGPRQLEYDATTGQLFVVDVTNNRILTYGTPETASSGGDTFHFFGF